MSGTSPDFDEYSLRLAAMRRLEDEIVQKNKVALFDALHAAGVTTVMVAFDGYGDSGQIESVDAFDGAQAAITLPESLIEIAQLTSDRAGVEMAAKSLREILEELSYFWLERSHDGWENDTGAYGTFVFNVGDRTIRLEYNERYESSEYYEHDF